MKSTLAVEKQLNAVAPLAEPVRRKLYLYVGGRPEPVTREEAAAAVGISRELARFHLDRLEAAGLLVSGTAPAGRRRTGRTGRPAKAYRRADRALLVAVPPRNYQLLSRIMLEALSGSGPKAAVARSADRAATRLGVETGESARRSGSEGPPGDEGLPAALDTLGFNPRSEGPGAISLANCPFHEVVAENRDLVCGLNLKFMQGLLQGLGCTHSRAVLSPGEGRCCVELRQD